MTTDAHPELQVDVGADLLELARSVEMQGPNAFALAGSEMVVNADREALERALSERLYQGHYCRPSADDATPAAPRRTPRELLAAYSDANCGTGTWESGWRVVDTHADGRTVVERRGIRFWVTPDQIRIGDRTRVAVPKELQELVPGYYYFLGDAIDDEDEGDDVARFYWHVTEAGAVALVAALSTALNAAGIPFRAKILRIPGAFRRADAGVLYLHRRFVTPARPLLHALYTEVRSSLRASTPMFTLPLAPGLAVADDPGPYASFGLHRCGLAARGLLASYEGRPPTQDERLASLSRTFLAAGLDPREPHLRSADAVAYTKLASAFG